jgi:hypothetical protein
MERNKLKPRDKEIIWSQQLGYAVGLIASDGCLSSDMRHLNFVSKDLEQIETLRECLGIRAKIAEHKSGRANSTELYYRLQWRDTVLYDFFLSIGLTPKKSLNIGALDIPDDYFFDFLRGSFDGDGCFYSYFDPRWKNSFMFYVTLSSASEMHIKWLRENLQRLVNIKGHITFSKKGKGIFNLKYAKKESLILLANVYKERGAPCLSRKKLKISDALRIVGKSLP